MRVDVLAIGAHPDDVELTCGGTLVKLRSQGYTFAMADMTQGELGTRGTKDVRAKEAAKAAKILGASARRNLAIPDGNIEVSSANLRKVITLIREFRPKVLLIPHSVERHPDHVHTQAVCKEAWFYAGLAKIRTNLHGQAQHPHRPDVCFEFMQWFEFQPSFIVDISETYNQRLKAIRAHASQFHNPRSKEPQTRLSKPDFLELLETRARYYGSRIGVRYGEPFFSSSSVGVQGLFDVLVDKG